MSKDKHNTANRPECALAALNNTLRERLLDAQHIDVAFWNEVIAPALSEMAMAITDTTISARTYRLPFDYFE